MECRWSRALRLRTLLSPTPRPSPQVADVQCLSPLTETANAPQLRPSGKQRWERVGGGGGIREHLEPLEGADVIVGWTVQELGVLTAATMQMLVAHKAAEPEPLRRIFSAGTSITSLCLTRPDLADRWWTGKPVNVNDSRKWKNTQAAPICMCSEAAGRGICFSKKLLPGKKRGRDTCTEY